MPKAVPPVAEANQLIVPALATACNVTVPASHLLAGVVLVIEGIAFIVAVIAVRGEIQVPLATST